MKLVYFTLIIFLFSCGLTDTRQPEDPETPRSDFIAATTPEILFNNLTKSLEEKITENYLSSFVDTSFLNIKYSFIPSASSLNQFSDLANWNIESERQFFNNLKAVAVENSPIILVLQNENSNIQIDSAIYEYDYNITLTTSDASLSNMYEGSVRFTIHRDSRNWWVISKWEDIESGTNPSWSELKGRLY